jgi:hypothetical protein
MDGEQNVARYNEKVAKRGPVQSQDVGFTGPSYSYADELPTPAQIGVRSGGDAGAIIDAASAVNYYVDTIGFGQKTMFNPRDMEPLGVRYFLNTGAICSNGASMYDYVDTIPKGNLLGKRVDKGLSDMGLPRMRGLAPGIMEDARDALNPMPLLRAAVGGGYPQCRLVTYPVGDGYGRLASPSDASNVWVKGDIVMVNGRPHQARWIQDVDNKDATIFLDRDAWEKAPKTYYPDGKPIEGFTNAPAFWEEYVDKKTVAGLLLAGLAVAFATYAAHKD